MATVNVTEHCKRVIVEENGVRVVSVGLQGPPGPDGEAGQAGLDGSSFLHGTADPISTDGANGDLWANTTSWDVFEKAGGGWSLVGNIKGADGAGGGVSQFGWSGFEIGSGIDTDHDLTVSSGRLVTGAGDEFSYSGALTVQLDQPLGTLLGIADDGWTMSAGGTAHLHLVTRDSDSAVRIVANGSVGSIAGSGVTAGHTWRGLIASFRLDGSGNLWPIQSSWLSSPISRLTNLSGEQLVYDSGNTSNQPGAQTVAICPADASIRPCLVELFNDYSGSAGNVVGMYWKPSSSEPAETGGRRQFAINRSSGHHSFMFGDGWQRFSTSTGSAYAVFTSSSGSTHRIRSYITAWEQYL